MENYTLIIIDYYLQQVEAGNSKAEAAKKARYFMYTRFREKSTRADYMATYELIDRLSKQ